MNDTKPTIAAIHREAMMKRSPQDRFVMGTRMFDTARDMVLASITAEHSPAEARIKYFLRLYQSDFPADALPQILNWIRSTGRPSHDAGDEPLAKDQGQRTMDININEERGTKNSPRPRTKDKRLTKNEKHR